jgi:hypothetical protein
LGDEHRLQNIVGTDVPGGIFTSMAMVPMARTAVRPISRRMRRFMVVLLQIYEKELDSATQWAKKVFTKCRFVAYLSTFPAFLSLQGTFPAFLFGRFALFR